MDPTAFVIPCLLAGVALYALTRRVDVYAALTQGAGEGLTVVAKILPALVGLLTAVYMLRASGPWTPWRRRWPGAGASGDPAGDGGAAAGAAGQRFRGSGGGQPDHGAVRPGLRRGPHGGVMLGCSETTFYTVAVYFGAAGIRRTRYTIPAALTADLAAFVAAAWAVRLCFG